MQTLPGGYPWLRNRVNQILSRCFLSAMAMASEREEAPSLEKIVCRWALTPSGPTSNSRWAHYEAGERIPTDIHGLTVEDVAVERPERLLNLQGRPRDRFETFGF